jgi:prepilin signal peptidase PulO-like enzyme (type II secretory pathway)
LLAFIAAMGYITFLLFHVAKAVEKKAFIKKISVDKLVPGDWLAEDIKNKKVVLIAVKDLKTGLEKKHLKQIKKEGIKHVTVKEGIPFVPSFLLGYVATIYLYEPIVSYFSLIF